MAASYRADGQPKLAMDAYEHALAHNPDFVPAYDNLGGLLAEIGNALKSHCRLIDFAFRYGGDEFVILLPQTSKDNAINVARRLHKLIREAVWLPEEGLHIRVTPSVGVASYPVDSRTKEGLLHLADEAMYLVKNTNRDSVAVANLGILPEAADSAESAG